MGFDRYYPVRDDMTRFMSPWLWHTGVACGICRPRSVLAFGHDETGGENEVHGCGGHGRGQDRQRVSVAPGNGVDLRAFYQRKKRPEAEGS